METETYYQMPMAWNNGYTRRDIPPKFLSIEEVIDLANSKSLHEDVLRAKHFLNKPLPPQVIFAPIVYAGVCYNSLHDAQMASQRYKAKASVTKGDKKLKAVKQRKWYNGLRPDGRKRGR